MTTHSLGFTFGAAAALIVRSTNWSSTSELLLVVVVVALSEWVTVCFCHKSPQPSACRCMQSSCWLVDASLLHCWKNKNDFFFMKVIFFLLIANYCHIYYPRNHVYLLCWSQQSKPKLRSSQNVSKPLSNLYASLAAIIEGISTPTQQTPSRRTSTYSKYLFAAHIPNGAGHHGRHSKVTTRNPIKPDQHYSQTQRRSHHHVDRKVRANSL